MDKRIQSEHPSSVSKVRFIEPGNPPYRRSLSNLFTYDKYLRTPSTGLLTLTTIVKNVVDDTLMYSESISRVRWNDVYSADIVFIGIFTFNANRGYEIAAQIRAKSKALVVMGGLHASLCYEEAIEHCDYVLLSEADESIVEFIFAVQTQKVPEFEGVAYKKNGRTVCTGYRTPPLGIDTIPNRNLLYSYRKMVGYNTLWPQVHASRGCPHRCDYCVVIAHFGNRVRRRSVENIVADIRSSIAFYHSGLFPRLNRALWITDDNFFADRNWAMAVLRAIIESKIHYRFTVQARFEVGFDDEMLQLLKKAGFFEIAIGIEFLEDESFEQHHKKCTTTQLERSILNIQKHGLAVRGLFIVGADNHTAGVGDRIADFVFTHRICGVVIQSMYFVPGTQAYENNKHRLLHTDWSKCTGHVVHYPAKLTPYELQMEIIRASGKIYSVTRLVQVLAGKSGHNRLLFLGEFFWQRTVRKRLQKELRFLKAQTRQDTSLIPQ